MDRSICWLTSVRTLRFDSGCFVGIHSAISLAAYSVLTQVCSVRWNHNGQYIAIGDDQQTVTLYDAKSQKTLRKLHGHASRIGAMSWNHSVLSTGSADSTVRNNDVRQKRYCINTLECHEQEICGLEWDNAADGTHLASGNVLCVFSIWSLHSEHKYILWKFSNLSLSTFRALIGGDITRSQCGFDCEYVC